MAIYRQLHTSFWQDCFVLSLTPEEKYFYIYLLTNSKTKQCGIYELPIRIAEMETGFNRETVEKLLKRFIEAGKVQFDWSTSEIAIKNWLKYNPDNNPKIKSCIIKELEGVKNRDLIPYVYPMDTLCIPYAYPMDRVSQEEKNNKKNNKRKEEEEVCRAKNKFSPPTLTELGEFFQDKSVNSTEAEKFFNYYESNGWKVGKNPMKNWKAAAANWIKNINNYGASKTSTQRISKTDYRAAAAKYDDLEKFGDLTVGEIFGVGRDR